MDALYDRRFPGDSMEQRRSHTESFVIEAEFWRGRRIFLTGHTGFKGAWASMLLHVMGARVFGLALPPEHRDGVFVASEVEQDENDGRIQGYRETDPVGGHDPYSNSKGCAELVTSAYRRSFFYRADDAAIVAVLTHLAFDGTAFQTRWFSNVLGAVASRSETECAIAPLA
ncbi:hypothetical protein I6F35_00885 [Bradyrhizobium sp. BRP22]|uniref:hypothetical protein n=1 Tax=Bradyrhizobium sp. BRP22 TaxID=2793821 RepID=UPI0031FCE2F6|nr:hypothetical protein [Bradyrhizobium sp. BRP22]